MNNLLKKMQTNKTYVKLYNFFVKDVSFSEIQSFLIEAFDDKRQHLGVSDIFRQYKNDPYVQPSTIDPRSFLKFDQLLFSHLPSYIQPIELSPVSPLGCCSQLGPISQKRIISTIRKSEVSSDPTNVLALEASKRRKECNKPVSLAVSQRLLRAEKIHSKDSFPHFKIFSICFADRDKGNYLFEMNACRELVSFYDTILINLKKREYSFSDSTLIFKFRTQSILNKFKKAFSDIKQQFTQLSLEFIIDDSERWNYYSTIRFNLFITIKGKKYFISDGGDTNWTQKILNNKKERYFISGLGSERMLALFNFK